MDQDNPQSECEITTFFVYDKIMCHLLTYIKTKQLEKQKIKQETIVFKKVAINYRSLAFYRILLLNFHINPERIDFPPHFL